MVEYKSASGSQAEDLFIEIFADTFGAEKAGYLYSQYPFYIYIKMLVSLILYAKAVLNELP